MSEDFEKLREEQHVDPGSNEPWQVVKQTEGLDADETRRVAGPDWESGVQGDVKDSDVERPTEDSSSGGSGQG